MTTTTTVPAMIELRWEQARETPVGRLPKYRFAVTLPDGTRKTGPLCESVGEVLFSLQIFLDEHNLAVDWGRVLPRDRRDAVRDGMRAWNNGNTPQVSNYVLPRFEDLYEVTQP